MRLKLVPAFIFMSFILLGCNSCVETKYRPYSFDRYKGYYTKPEQAEKSLVEYITQRTVRVIVLCKVYNKDTGVLIKDTYEAGWGTGTILYSSKEFSLIQTANHVAVVKDALNGNLKRVCSGFYIERRNQDDKIIHVFKGNTKIVAKDPLSDLAVIKVFYNFNVSSRIAQDTYLGQSIRIIGFPSLRGIKAKRLSYEKGYVATRLGDAGWLKHQTRFGTAAYFGNSGGAVWNQQGEIVGTVTNLVGFSTLLGDYIPQQNCVYGPGARALQNFYNSYKDLKFLLKI